MKVVQYARKRQAIKPGAFRLIYNTVKPVFQSMPLRETEINTPHQG